MPPDRELTNALEAYKTIIDELVNETSASVSERLVRTESVYSRAHGQSMANDFVSALSDDQRKVLSGMLIDERVSAIHDVLAMLTWWLTCGGVALTFRGEPMPIDLSGMGLHGDFVGRRDNWPWPNG